MILNKIPTGIKTFDININDGFPSGSVILLLEDIGAGAREFIYTSIYNISQMKTEDNINFTRRYKSKDVEEIIAIPMLPGKICYISVSKSLEDILKENAYAFQKDFYKSLQQVIFEDLSDTYFCHSEVNNLWNHNNNKNNNNQKNNLNKSILEEISDFINKNAENNIIIIDSLTDLMLFDNDGLNKNDIFMFLKGMAKVSKVWNGLIYIILSANILDDQMQEIIKDIVDGVLVFEWFKDSDKMKRNLYLSKFRGLIPRLEQNKISKFETKVTYDNGFEVSNVRKII